MTKLIVSMSLPVHYRGKSIKAISGCVLLGYISIRIPVIKPTNFLMNSLIVSRHVYITTPILILCARKTFSPHGKLLNLD